jgi:tRNA pseudouridine38-40 synthase
VQEVDPAFHPRFQARQKTYEYRICRTEICSPFERRFVHHHPYPLDEQRMVELAPLLQGEHDFTCFAAADERDARGDSKVRTIYVSHMERQPGHLLYRVTGSGFLKHMVRNIVGTLLEGGKGNLDAAGLRRLLNPPVERAGPTAPACGLFLVQVNYWT